MDALDECGEELDDLMGTIIKDYPDVTVTDQGGGLSSFIARRNDDIQSKKRWWQFWK